jgi:hypothetical protein
MRARPETQGKLRIGDDWNAITIIALSQDNPLKAVAEFVENAIDAGARNITITRGKERGEHYLSVVDDGAGVPRDESGAPDFRYVATHICDSVKRRLKAAGGAGLQGEFGIGLLSFWTVGEELAMTSAGADGRVVEMRMRKGDPRYAIRPLPLDRLTCGTRLRIKPLLPGIRQLSGEKIQWYLASELRERIAGVQIRIVDRQARKEFKVEPRQFTGRLLHHLPPVTTVYGEAWVELYLGEAGLENAVGLHRNGTRILPSIAELDSFARSPWNDGLLQGIVDAPFLNLTPATRTGVIHDAALVALREAAAPLEDHLRDLIDEQNRAQEEQATQDTVRSIQRAFREAMLTLPEEEYDFFEVGARRPGGQGSSAEVGAEERGASKGASADARQRQFFEFSGPLHSVRISPASCTVAVGTQRTFRAVARDASRRRVEDGLSLAWRVAGGSGRLDDPTAEIPTLYAPAGPGLVRIAVTATQAATTCEAEALVTVTDELLPDAPERKGTRHGLPGYTLQHAPGQLWRSRHDSDANAIVVNSGHRDFLYASRTKTLKLRYLVRLYAKEMVRKNFPGLPGDQLLERLIELCLYAEEHLR